MAENSSASKPGKSVYLPPDIFQRLEGFAKRTHRTMGGAIAALLDSVAEPLPKPARPSTAETPA